MEILNNKPHIPRGEVGCKQLELGMVRHGMALEGGVIPLLLLFFGVFLVTGSYSFLLR